MRFSKSEMEEFRSMVDGKPTGTTVHIHHCKQGAGNDRLYITLKENCVVAYCHHCNMRGSILLYLPTLSKYKKNTINKSVPKKLPVGVADPRLWPVQALAWPSKAKLSFTSIQDNGFLWCPSIGRVVYPVINDGYQGYIARLVEGEGPKYLASVVDKSKFVVHKPVNDSKTCIIVEDLLSCIKVAESGNNCIALLGTSLSDQVKSVLLSNYDKYIIWLDNDNPQVKLNQAKLKRELELYGKVGIIKTTNDPKTYSSTEINKLLELV